MTWEIIVILLLVVAGVSYIAGSGLQKRPPR